VHQIITSALLAKYWVEAMDMDVIILALINGIVVGLGVTIGSYIANKALIQQLESALNKLKKEFKNPSQSKMLNE
jgi:hypothetical protein